jgi:hypothetical protein
VLRSRTVEPVHGLGAGKHIQPLSEPVSGLYQTSTAQIYPALVNGEAVIRLAAEAFERLKPQLVSKNLHQPVFT